MENGVIHVKPIKRHTWLPSGHDGEIRYTGCAEYLAVQMDLRSRRLNTGLSSDDEGRLEKALKLPPGTLNAYNYEYWGNFKQTIRIDKNGLILNLSNPKDEITYKNLLVHTDVANSVEEVEDNPSYKYVISSVDQEAKVRNTKNKVKQEAYKLFGKLSLTELTNVLKLRGKRTGKDASRDFIESEVVDFLEKTPDQFVELVKDPMFTMKVFVSDCISVKSLVKRGPKYMLHGGDSIGNSIEEAIAFLEDPHNQDIYLSLKAKIETKEA